MRVAFERNRAEIYDAAAAHARLHLSERDLAGIDYVYRAFYSAGPDIRYSFGRGPGWQPFPSYSDLMTADDGQGVQRELPRDRRDLPDAARHGRAQPDRPARRRFRRPEGAALRRRATSSCTTRR